jgi:predicted metalloprotease with PDZ domain
MRSGSGYTHQFSTEPRIRGLLDGSPADGKLEDGDILIAIDGVLITTREGGRRLANLKPGMPVTLRIRRDGKEMDVTLVPRLGCNMPSLAVMADPVRAPAARPAIAPRAVSETAPAQAARPAIAPRATREAAPAVTAVAPRAVIAPVLPPFTFGLELECGSCGWRSESDGVRWSSPSLPTIRSVEPGGPGDQAGLKPGDVLVEIDGHLLNNEEAGREIGKLRPGHAVQVRFLRGREDKTITLTPRSGVPPAQPF